MQHSTLALALVDDAGHPGAPDQRAGHRQRLVQHDRLLAMHELEEVDAQFAAIAHPEAGRSQHGRHGRQGHEVTLVGEAQLRRIQRVGPDAHPERIEDGVARGVGVAHVVASPGLGECIVDH